LIPIYSRFGLRWGLRGAAKVIALTPGYKTILIEEFGVSPERVVVIPNATSFVIKNTMRSGVGAPLRMLAVGRISVQKNYEFLIEVAHALKYAHGLNFMLTVVGDGDDRARLEALVRARDLADEVQFVGAKMGAELQAAYEAADIFILVSLMEGVSIVLLEAMSKGLPIVASKVIGTRDVVEHERNGLLAPLQVEAMSAAVMRLASDPAFYQRISLNNLEDVRRYDWSAILQQPLQTYRTV